MICFANRTTEDGCVSFAKIIMKMKKLNITKEQYSGSEYAKKYGKLKFVSESRHGNLYKTEKGRILKFVTEAREYVDDSSIEADTAEEFIIFEDPDIFQKIANVQKQEEKKVEQEIKNDDVDKKDVAQAANQGPGIGAQVASSSISGATSIVTNPTVISLAAGAVAANKVADITNNVINAHNQTKKAQANLAQIEKGLAIHKDDFASQGIDFDLMKHGFKYMDRLSDEQLDAFGDSPIHNMEYHKLVAKSLPDGERDNYLKSAQNLCDKYGSTAVAAGAGVAGTAAGGAASGAAATSGGAASTGLFGLSLSTIGWIAAGVAAAAIITPYIYDKVRACSKTWMADIIAEIKFKADGKNYRCFYDLDENKWVLTYADVKWTSYMDNKLDKETIEEFFASNFF